MINVVIKLNFCLLLEYVTREEYTKGQRQILQKLNLILARIPDGNAGGNDAGNNEVNEPDELPPRPIRGLDNMDTLEHALTNSGTARRQYVSICRTKLHQ